MFFAKMGSARAKLFGDTIDQIGNPGGHRPGQADPLFPFGEFDTEKQCFDEPNHSFNQVYTRLSHFDEISVDAREFAAIRTNY